MNADKQRGRKQVPLGYIAGVYGIKGWVKIHSWTSPKLAILEYQPWLLGEEKQAVRIKAGRPQGKTIVVSLPGVENREQAAELVGQEISVYRDQLPATNEDEYYWSDLVGLAVENRNGVELGNITKMMETGAHDVMVIQGDRERIIPFIPGRFVTGVDLEAGKLTVDWEPDYLV